MTRDRIRELSNPQLVATTFGGGEWPRPLLSRVTVPVGWLALRETSDGRRRLVAAGEDPDAGDEDRLTLVRDASQNVHVALERLDASDGHAVSAGCELRVRCRPNEDDLSAFRRALLGGGELTVAALQSSVAAVVAPAIRAFVRRNEAASLVQHDRRSDLHSFLRGELKRFAFESGVSIELVVRADFSSRGLIEQEALQRDTSARLEQIRAREMIEQAALQATQKRLSDLSGVFDKLQNAAAGAAGDAGRWRELLPTLSPAERGRLLENLWRLTPNRSAAAAIVAVSGMELVWLDPLDPRAITRRVTLPDDLGGLRSVGYCPGGDEATQRPGVGDAGDRGGSPDERQCDEATKRRSDEATNDEMTNDAPSRAPTMRATNAGARMEGSDDEPSPTPAAAVLLVGAATGVWELDPESGEVIRRHAVPDAGRPRTGFNASVRVGDRIYATHSQLGFWWWPIDDPLNSHAPLRPEGGSPKSIRGVADAGDGRVAFAADEVVYLYDAAQDRLMPRAPVGAEVTNLAVRDGWVYVSTARGMILRDRLDGSQEVWEVVHRAVGAIESLAIRRWNDLFELVIPAGMQGVLAVYPDEQVVAKLLSAPFPIRRAWACDDCVLALDDQRERLIVMNLNMPERAGRDVPIARMLGRSVQDACIITQPRTSDASGG